MWFKKKLVVLLTIGVLASPSLRAEIKTFVGIDAVQTETVLTYANGDETYDFTGVRLRYGIENSDGGSAGFEIITGDSDDITDPFGNPFRLETGESFGVYATLGKPVYVRVGWSIWETEYTDLTTDITDKESVDSLEIGVGVNLLLGRNLTVYAEYALRDTESSYPAHIAGNGELDYESELLSLGFNFLF